MLVTATDMAVLAGNNRRARGEGLAQRRSSAGARGRGAGASGWEAAAAARPALLFFLPRSSSFNSLKSPSLPPLTHTHHTPTTRTTRTCSEACWTKYGVYPLHRGYCHEQAVRILLSCLDTNAARCVRARRPASPRACLLPLPPPRSPLAQMFPSLPSLVPSPPRSPFKPSLHTNPLLPKTLDARRHKKVVVPLLSLSIDFYVRVFVRVYNSPLKSKEAAARLAYVWQSQGCDSFHLQRVGQARARACAPARLCAARCFSRRRGRRPPSSPRCRSSPSLLKAFLSSAPPPCATYHNTGRR